ncbi:hypothetical protein FX988_04288 (plasmid) [Paraglaciecola mesophila]|uniref:MSHA biogenesis protein MshQ n=2 Tax=Paraglaciecola mesophila TaxID=197222 RepID=A0A857JRB1_9ALTE|nr:hypothetical protein FX988_04288 [Paraglaciecola mesophila]
MTCFLCKPILNFIVIAGSGVSLFANATDVGLEATYNAQLNQVILTWGSSDDSNIPGTEDGDDWCDATLVRYFGPEEAIDDNQVVLPCTARTYTFTDLEPVVWGFMIQNRILQLECEDQSDGSTYCSTDENEVSRSSHVYVNLENPGGKRRVTFIHTDILGSPIAETDINGDSR